MPLQKSAMPNRPTGLSTRTASSIAFSRRSWPAVSKSGITSQYTASVVAPDGTPRYLTWPAEITPPELIEALRLAWERRLRDEAAAREEAERKAAEAPQPEGPRRGRQARQAAG